MKVPNLKTISVSLLIFSAFGCATSEKRTTLLLEEIMAEQAALKEPMDNKDHKASELWEPAQVERRWVPTQYRGNRIYIPGHYEFVVIKPGRWKKQ